MPDMVKMHSILCSRILELLDAFVYRMFSVLIWRSFNKSGFYIRSHTCTITRLSWKSIKNTYPHPTKISLFLKTNPVHIKTSPSPNKTVIYSLFLMNKPLAKWKILTATEFVNKFHVQILNHRLYVVYSSYFVHCHPLISVWLLLHFD